LLVGRHSSKMAQMVPKSQLDYARKQRAYAWAQFYEARREQHQGDYEQYEVARRVADVEGVPVHIKAEMKEMAVALKKQWDCPICVDFIPLDTLDITNCGHFYCKPCLAQWKTTEKQNGKEKWKCCKCNREHKYKDD